MATKRATVAKAAGPHLAAVPGGPTAVTITAPNFQVAVLEISGTAPLVIHAFGQKAKETMVETQKAGAQSAKGKKKEPKDFDAVYEAARHRSPEGWDGIPASAFRCAMIDACRLAGFKMVLAKQSLHVLADGIDKSDGTPLVKITGGEPRRDIRPARNSNGSMDIRCRPWWDTWGATVRVRFDADLFTPTDVANLLMRAGAQVGVCEGRPFSRNSAGMGWGTFAIEQKKEKKA